ncbi:glutamate ligase domain-containing protein, partial [Rhodomicrobium udaipurense]
VLSAARGAARGRVIAVVQPHRYSRLQSLFGEFCACFADADTVVVTPVYSAGEQPNGIDRDTLVEGLRQQGHARIYPVDGEDTLVSTLAAVAQPGDLVLTLGAGTISEWARALAEKLNHYPAFAGAAE